MKKLTLNISERIILIGIFNSKELKGDVETLRAILEDVPKISISLEEKQAIGFREVKDELGSIVSFAWDDPKEIEVELNQKTIDLVLKYIDDKSKAQQLTLADYPLLDIQDKLKE